MCISSGQTTANNCKTPFSLHVVESDYNFYFQFFCRLHYVTNTL